MNTNVPATGNYPLPTTDKPIVLLIEYKIDGLPTDDDFDKRWRLQRFVDRLLTGTGLGECDGGSIGHNIMVVSCFVANFEKARRVLEQALSDTEFSNYTRIVEENEEYWASETALNESK